MEIITKYPVYVNKEKVAGEDYLSFDSTNTAQVKAFQNWLDVKYPTWLNGGKLNKQTLKGYGNYGHQLKKLMIVMVQNLSLLYQV